MAKEDTSVVRTAKLTKVFRDFWLREKVTAVCDLDLDIGRHEVFGLLGPNGAARGVSGADVGTLVPRLEGGVSLRRLVAGGPIKTTLLE